MYKEVDITKIDYSGLDYWHSRVVNGQIVEGPMTFKNGGTLEQMDHANDLEGLKALGWYRHYLFEDEHDDALVVHDNTTRIEFLEDKILELKLHRDKTEAELAYEQASAQAAADEQVKQQLIEIDLASIRSIREWVAQQETAPAILVEKEALAVEARATLATSGKPILMEE